MIPLRLTLHNFMCYRDPGPLDFRGLHLACLAGNNGHGKSALLDAITWSLWGKARSNQADDLIHLGESDMWVDFEFLLGPNHYRVLRSRERKGRGGKSDLQLQVWAEGDEDAAEFRPITEPTIRQTEERIVQLLRMDYETFINSAFLVQGRADEFTVKPPGQRKQILAEILGLGLYDVYETRAKERARARAEGVTRAEAQLETIDAELAQEPQYRNDLETAEALVAELAGRLAAADEQLRALRGDRQDLLAQRRLLQDLESRLARGQRDLAEVGDQIRATESRLVADQGLLRRRGEIEQGYQALVEARQADQRWNEKLAQQASLQAQHSRLLQSIGQARSQLEAEERIADERARRLRAQVQRRPVLQEKLTEAQSHLAELAQQEERRSQLQGKLSGLAAEDAALQARSQRLKTDMHELKERLDLLAQAGAACPVCGQTLDEGKRQEVLAEYQRQGQVWGDDYRSVSSRVREIQDEVGSFQAEKSKLERDLRGLGGWQRQEAQSEAQLAEIGQAAVQLAETEELRGELAARLVSEDYASEAQAELAGVAIQLEALGYDPTAHDQVRDHLLHQEPFQDQYSQLQVAQEREQELLANLERLKARRDRWQETLSADQAQQETLAAAVARLSQVELQLQAQSSTVDQLAQEERLARQRLGAAQQRLDACHAFTQQRKTLSRELEELRAELSIYQELQAAFGKKGLQAMIIEAAIPEIEAEANRLLNRMTDGRMSVRMETQRETKTTQELRETLDIILSDELGSRDYALFSGGEAFRANFAIRIALSKLLARRAGARLQTLIVDEGFGTQDAQGRERLVEAITSIQDDFERILVVTHIDELKDHFPVRIDVIKTSEGSQILLGN